MTQAKVTQEEINGIVWKACDTFRGVVDPSEYKNYILVFLFIKYLSDVWKDKFDEHLKKFNNDAKMAERVAAAEAQGCRRVDARGLAALLSRLANRVDA